MDQHSVARAITTESLSQVGASPGLRPAVSLHTIPKSQEVSFLWIPSIIRRPRWKGDDSDGDSTEGKIDS